MTGTEKRDQNIRLLITTEASESYVWLWICPSIHILFDLDKRKVIPLTIRVRHFGYSNKSRSRNCLSRSFRIALLEGISYRVSGGKCYTVKPRTTWFCNRNRKMKSKKLMTNGLSVQHDRLKAGRLYHIHLHLPCTCQGSITHPTPDRCSICYHFLRANRSRTPHAWIL